MNEGTHFTFDIPLVDFNQLSQNATSAFNLMQALTTPVPDDVAAMGSEYSDYYRRAIARGFSSEQAAAFVSTPEFADTVAKFGIYNKLVEQYGADSRIPSQYAYALALDLDAQLDENGQLYIRTSCGEAQAGPCARLNIDPSKPVAREQLQALLNQTYAALEGSLDKGDIATVLKANTQYALALQCALNWMQEGGSARDMYQLVFAGGSGTPAENARRFIQALGGTSSSLKSSELAQGLEILSYYGSGDIAGLRQRFAEIQAQQAQLVASGDARQVQEGLTLSRYLYKMDAVLKAYDAGDPAEASRLLNFALTYDTSVVLASLQNMTFAGRGGGRGTSVREPGELTGTPDPINPRMDEVTRHALMGERYAADVLVANGYNVEQQPSVPGPKNPDYRITGGEFDDVIFDAYSPTTGNARNISTAVQKKIDDGQANNIVLNLERSPATVAQIREQFREYPIQGLQNMIVIDQSGRVFKFKY